MTRSTNDTQKLGKLRGENHVNYLRNPAYELFTNIHSINVYIIKIKYYLDSLFVTLEMLKISLNITIYNLSKCL